MWPAEIPIEVEGIHGASLGALESSRLGRIEGLET